MTQPTKQTEDVDLRDKIKQMMADIEGAIDDNWIMWRTHEPNATERAVLVEAILDNEDEIITKAEANWPESEQT